MEGIGNAALLHPTCDVLLEGDRSLAEAAAATVVLALGIFIALPMDEGRDSVGGDL